MSLPDPTETFRQEARELLEQLEAGLLDLEQNPQDGDLINSTFRALHTIKGSGAMFGFTAVATFVHEFETAFDRVRKGQSVATPALIAIALDAKDQIHKLIETPDADVPGGDAILDALRRTVSTDSFPEAPLSKAEPVAAAPAEPAAKRWRVRFKLPSDALVNGTNPLLLLDEIRAIGPCDILALTDGVPGLGAIDPEATYLGWQVDLTTDDDPHGAIDDVFMFLRDGMELSIEPLHDDLVVLDDGPLPVIVAEPAASVPEKIEKATPAGSAPITSASATADKTAASSSLRVPAERLDELMDRVGELVIAQARLKIGRAHV